MSLSHLVLWSELAGDLENETHQSSPRKDKRVDDVPVMECQDAETERRGGTDVRRDQH